MVKYIWSNYSDLTRPHPKWWFSKGNPLISGKSRLVKYYNLARSMVKYMYQVIQAVTCLSSIVGGHALSCLISGHVFIIQKKYKSQNCQVKNFGSIGSCLGKLFHIFLDVFHVTKALQCWTFSTVTWIVENGSKGIVGGRGSGVSMMFEEN